MRRKHLLVILLAILPLQMIKSQDVAIKSNLASDALLNINLGVEVGLAPKWTLDLTGQFNGWTFKDGMRWKNWAAQPEARYWFCDRFAGHFLGLHAHGGQYNMAGFNGLYNFLGTDARRLKDYRFQGWFVGAGLGYGYSWILGRHWNLEAEVGVGYSYTQYDRFLCVGCGRKVEQKVPHHYVGPTKLALNLIYVF